MRILHTKNDLKLKTLINFVMVKIPTKNDYKQFLGDQNVSIFFNWDEEKKHFS